MAREGGEEGRNEEGGKVDDGTAANRRCRAHGGQRDSQTPQKAELPLLKFQHGGFLFVTDKKIRSYVTHLSTDQLPAKKKTPVICLDFGSGRVGRLEAAARRTTLL